MALMQYDAVTLGDHDLAPGPEFVSELVGWLDQPILATNYDLPGKGHSERTRMVTIQEKKVGLLAFLDPELTRENARWLKVEKWKKQKRLVRRLRRQCDVLIAMAHVADTTKVVALTDLYPEIDLVITAHEGKFAGPLAQYNDTYVAGGPGRGRYLGRVEIGFTPEGETREMASAYLPVVKQWGRRPNVDSLIFGYQDKMRALVLSDEYQNERLNSLEEPPVEFVGNAGCVSCHGSQTDQWKTTLHAKARATLEHEDKQHDPECQKCHTTGFGYRTGFATPEATPAMWNVGCESCHGAGAEHLDSPDEPYGEISETQCITCHTKDNSPDFNYPSYFPKVVHEALGTPETESDSGH